jgi:hypothetical protein
MAGQDDVLWPIQWDVPYDTGAELLTIITTGEEDRVVIEKSDDELERLSNLFGMPLRVAAKRTGMRVTRFKAHCRRHGIERWPFRKARCLNRIKRESGGTLRLDPPGRAYDDVETRRAIWRHSKRRRRSSSKV